MAELSYYENQVAQLERELQDARDRLERVQQAQNDAANAANRRYENLIASGIDPASDQEYQS